MEYPAEEITLPSHADTWERLQAVLARIDGAAAANAFLYSLSTRGLEYRSALGSFCYAKAIPPHEAQTHGNPDHCYLCGWNGKAWLGDPYEAFAHDRAKYGGIGHTQAGYALYDLEAFEKLPPVTPTETDRELLRRVLGCVNDLEPRQKAGRLRDVISKKKLLKANRQEITVLLEILGICGILAGRDDPGYGDRFADEYERSPAEHTNDMAYPLNRWHAADGINEERFAEIFGFPLAAEKEI